MLVTATMSGSQPPILSGMTDTAADAMASIIFVPVSTPVKMPAAKIMVETVTTLAAWETRCFC